jgi:hypothetical protein
MIPFSICAEITGAALAGSVDHVFGNGVRGARRDVRVGKRTVRPLSQRRSVQAQASGRAYVGPGSSDALRA